jgi:hypothetical protein
MRHPFTNRVSFFEPEVTGGFDGGLHPPMFFVAIQRETTPPVCFGQSRLQRMRIIFVEPERAAGRGETNGEPAFELLPQLPALPHRRALQPRRVNGEILCGENDELYERIGNRIRRLRTLAAGPNGEVIDIAKSEPPEKNEKRQDETPSGGYRRLLPEPGQRRVVPFGSFKQMLAPQLVHPERLRDAHRLPCHVSIFEVTAAQPAERLASSILGPAAAGQLQLVTPAVVLQLQLESLLQPRFQTAVARTPGMLLSGDRLFHLQVMNDPTTDDPEPARDLPAPSLKTSIPDRFTKPWEFQTSREEALYDLSCAATVLGSLGDKLRRLIHCLAFHREFRKWQVLLNGKTADEQLWSVRPPNRGLTHRFVRAWAQNALQLAGYDPRNMLTEWQIFWSRKGV